MRRAEILLQPQERSGGGGGANAAGHDTGRQHDAFRGRGRIANGKAHLSSQHGVPLEEPRLVPVTRDRVAGLKVTRLERRDDGHRSGAEGGWQEGRTFIEAGAGNLSPSFPGCEVRE